MGRVPIQYLAIGGAILLAAGSVEAQDRERRRANIPAGHLPPPGECRVWYDGRPPGQQPPPTSCAAARREAYRTGGRVIYGYDRYDDYDQYDDYDRYDDRDDRDRDRDHDRDRDRDRDSDRDSDRDRARDRDRDRDRDDDDDDDDDDEDDDRIYRDSRYPGDRRYPSSLPQTIWGVTYGRNQAAASGVRSWLGASNVRAQVTDANRDGRPEVVTWYDSRGAILQRWIDDNRDGRADRVGLYQNGRVVRVIR